MREELFDDPNFEEDFNEDWDNEKDNWDEMTYDQENFDNLPDWIDDVDDPENLDDFNFDDDFEDDMKWDE